jgi:tRNA pseudouridine38/39 synthase
MLCPTPVVQVRCIVAVLLMVGRGLEKPEVVQQLLDVGANPCKPQYNMAAEEPLLLYDCEFEGLEWQRSAASIQRNLLGLSAMVQKHLVSAALTHAMFEKVMEYYQQQQGQVEGAGGGSAVGGQAGAGAAAAARQWRSPLPPHVPLAHRAREPTMEDKFAKAGISMDLLNVSGAELRAAAAAAVGSGDELQGQKQEHQCQEAA